MDFKQSKQGKWLWNWAQPFWENMSSGNMPNMWEIPDTSQMMPGEGWWEGLDPNIKAGIREPYEDASRQMLEVMGAKGQTGSAASPYSGSSQTATGQFWADAGTGMANQGWGMVSPALQQGWQAQLMQNQGQYAQDMMPYGMLPGATQMSMPHPTVDPGTPGFGGMAASMLGPMAMGWGMGGFQNPFGGGVGGGWPGTQMPWSQGSGFNMNPY
jgi:hypothetical protein